jgi:hypothetical protein
MRGFLLEWHEVNALRIGAENGEEIDLPGIATLASAARIRLDAVCVVEDGPASQAAGFALNP